ncbi:MAG TPA: hypothetical protein VII95_04070 [Terriglobales bacterium]
MSQLIFGHRYPEIRLADLSEGNSHRLQAFRKKLLPRWTIADLNVAVTRILTPVQIQEQHSDMRCFMLVLHATSYPQGHLLPTPKAA